MKQKLQCLSWNPIRTLSGWVSSAVSVDGVVPHGTSASACKVRANCICYTLVGTLGLKRWIKISIYVWNRDFNINQSTCAYSGSLQLNNIRLCDQHCQWMIWHLTGPGHPLEQWGSNSYAWNRNNNVYQSICIYVYIYIYIYILWNLDRTISAWVHNTVSVDGLKPWYFSSKNSTLTHWGQVTHICVRKLIIIGSDNGLSPGRRQAIIWTNAGILSIEPLGINFT